MKDLTQKLWNSHSVKNKLKISSFKEIYHVASNENEFKTMNDLFVDNNSNNSSNNHFILTASFIHFALLIAVFNVTVH